MLKKTIIRNTLILSSLLMTVIASAAPSTQGGGQEYTVQAGDWLSKIAKKYYGARLAYPAIVNATNAKAATDNSFATITDPNRLEVGQKLWIPGTPEVGASAISDDEAALQQAYLNAVTDAAIAELDEISRNLIFIVESNDELVWRGEAENKQVLVLTWTSWDGYDEKVGQAMVNTRKTWVTTVPELKNFCTAYSATHNNLPLRLEQLLGLPPNNGKTRFIEIWVSPTDLFRPSPDPEITDQVAELTFPTSQYFTVSADYVTWFNNLSSQSYGENGYPWTRLGYTYDWGNPIGEVGLSEFIIDGGATVEIKGVIKTADYCR